MIDPMRSKQLDKGITQLTDLGSTLASATTIAPSQVLTGSKQKVPSDELDLRNLSALSVDPRTGHTLVLSADSHMLLELDELGEQVSFITLLGGFNGLKKTIPRPTWNPAPF